MTEIKNPTIDLFLYDLKSSLGDSLEEEEARYENFLSKMPNYVTEKLPLPKNHYHLKGEYVPLLDNNTNTIEIQPQNKQYKGYFYPVLLGDSYGLLIDCGVANEDISQTTNSFKGIKETIKQSLKYKTGYLGQTWMLSVSTSEHDPNLYEDIAKNCYQYFMGGKVEDNLSWEDYLEGEGDFLGGKIFELEQNKQHIIIIIYSDHHTFKKIFPYFYFNWINLLYYRHKTLCAYRQSRKARENLEQCFREIKTMIKDFKTINYHGGDFNKLEIMLIQLEKLMDQYNYELTLLDFQKGTMDINLTNYCETLKTLESKAKRFKKDAKINLKWLNKFTEFVRDKYILQITKDSENFKKGSTILSYKMNSIERRVEVAKAISDRNFQDTFTVIVAGWTFGSFVVNLGKLGEDKNDPIRLMISHSNLIPQPLVEPLIPLIYTLIAAVLAAISTAIVIWLLRKLWSRSL